MAEYRKQAMQQVAFDLSLNFQEEGTDALMPYLSGFKLFRRGRRQKITNILSYQDQMLEYQAYIFDYRYSVGSGKDRRTLHQTVFFIQSKKLGLPEFWMQPEKFFHKIGEYLGLTQDIDFTDYPEFSKHYRLKGEDEDYIRATMDDQLLHFFTINKNWYLEGVNYYMIFYKKNRIIAPAKIKDFYGKGLHLARLLEAEELGF